MGTIDKGKLVL